VVGFKALTDGRPIDPFGNDREAADGTYEQFLELDIDYESSSVSDDDPDQDDPTTFLEISSTASINFLADTIGSNGALWVPSGTDEDSAVDISVPSTVIETAMEWSFRWPQVPYEYFSDTLIARMRDALGKVNNAPNTLFHNAPAETILFLGYSISQTASWQRKDGVKVPPLNLDLKFLEKNFKATDSLTGTEIQVTHNHIYRPGFGWRRLLVNDSPLFGQTDMNAIFAK
jgi:hypothetical protein